jgi:outer membrane protein OmpA-like peptidoglycan-associated protein
LKYAFLFCFILTCFVAKAQAWQRDTVTVTYRDLSLQGKHGKKPARFQFKQIGDSNKYIVAANNLEKLPSFFKKIKIIESNTGNQITINRKKVFEFGMPLVEKQVNEINNDTIFFTNKEQKQRIKKTYKENGLKYYFGKQGGSFYKNNWIPLYPVSTSSAANILTLEVRGTFFKKARYKTDRIPTGFAPLLPAVDTPRCEPIDRFHLLRKMKGYGVERIKYERYNPPSRLVIRKEFEIFFDKNSSEAKSENIQEVIQYLEANNYSILNATMEGYSSLEGDEQGNIRLQRKRAAVMLKLLQQHNNEPIASDTVTISPGYDLFRIAIKNTPYKLLDTLSNQAIVKLINSDERLLNNLEPYLKPHRKAVLKLVVAKRIEGYEVIDRFKRDFAKLESQFDPVQNSKIAWPVLEAKVMGMLQYLFGLLKSGAITSEEFSGIIDGAWSNAVVRVLVVYHQIIEFEKLTDKDSVEWRAFSRTNKLDELFYVAQRNLINLIRDPAYRNQHERFRAQLVDIQIYSFDYVKRRWLSVDALCRLDFPDDPSFRGFKLNQLAFLQYLTKFYDVPCEQFRFRADEPRTKYTDGWLDEMMTRWQLEIETGMAKPPGERYAPNFGKEVASPLLFYLKKLYVKDESTIKKEMTISDDLSEFDIFTLCDFHVEEWNPFANYFADKEVQLAEMDKIINLLKSKRQLICPRSTNQLFLDYHLKALHYLSKYYEPGNQLHTNIAQQSLQFISNYYSQYAGFVTPRLSIYLLHQLNAFHWVPGKEDGTWYAMNLLSSIAKRRALSEDEVYLFTKYKTYFELPGDSGR